MCKKQQLANNYTSVCRHQDFASDSHHLTLFFCLKKCLEENQKDKENLQKRGKAVIKDTVTVAGTIHCRSSSLSAEGDLRMEVSRRLLLLRKI